MQTLVYLLIGLAALAVAGAAYFGFTFTPIEAIMLALLFAGLAVIAMERTLRQLVERGAAIGPPQLQSDFNRLLELCRSVSLR